MSQPVTVDVNVLVNAVVGGNDDFRSWPSPPPVRGNPAANVVGVLNDARELGLFLSEHILTNIVRVLAGTPPDGYGWEGQQAEDHVAVLAEIAFASDGDVLDPRTQSATARTTRTTESSSVLRPAGRCRSRAPTTICCRCPRGGEPPVVASGDFVTRADAMRRGHRR